MTAPQAKRLSEDRLKEASWSLRQYANYMRGRKQHPAEAEYAAKLDSLADDVAAAAAREEQVRVVVRIVKASQWPTEDPDTHEVGIWLDRNGAKALDDLLAALNPTGD